MVLTNQKANPFCFVRALLQTGHSKHLWAISLSFAVTSPLVITIVTSLLLKPYLQGKRCLALGNV